MGRPTFDFHTVRHLFDNNVVVLPVSAEFATQLGADGDVFFITLEGGDLVAQRCERRVALRHQRVGGDGARALFVDVPTQVLFRLNDVRF